MHECICNSDIEYLATPYSGDEETMDYRAEVSDFICSELMKEGRIVYAPISSAHHIAKKYGLPRDWEYWKKFDEEFIKACKRVLVITLPGWETSVGVTAECNIAVDCDIPIEYIDPAPYIKKLSEKNDEAKCTCKYGSCDVNESKCPISNGEFV